MLDIICELYDELMIADGFDDCIIGVAETAGQKARVAYDMQKVIEQLMSDGISEDDAWEYFEFNILGAYVGETTPVFIKTF